MMTLKHFASRFLILAFLGSLSSAFAQVRTSYVDLSRGDFVPLYDCSIFSNYQDTRNCRNLSSRHNYSFDYGGYAVSCETFRYNRYDHNDCRDLAYSLMRDRRAINCFEIRSPARREQCQATRQAYLKGYFEDLRPYRGTVTTRTTTTTTVDRDVYTHTVTTCEPTHYDDAYRRWDEQRRDAQARQGGRNTAVGVGTAIIGTILRGSDNRTVRAVGTGLQIGGALLATYGLVQLADASIELPHMTCGQNYVTETRTVTVERRTCESTRYTDRYSNRSYYEVRCETERYVTFDEFDPWHRGRTVTTTRY